MGENYYDPNFITAPGPSWNLGSQRELTAAERAYPEAYESSPRYQAFQVVALTEADILRIAQAVVRLMKE